jgi:hypothetical protein
VLFAIGDRFAASVVVAVQREYPNMPQHVMRSADDRPVPREAHPAFYGCFDWHSAVHMHWTLAVLVRAAPHAEWAPAARAVLDRHLSVPNLGAEAAYLAANPAWERPYGWGWALQLADELADWAADGDADAARWADALVPVAETVTDGLLAWLPKLAYPVRAGTHANTAFALCRALPWARRSAPRLAGLIEACAQRWFAGDADYPFGYEPSGADFLSAGLAEAELMRTVLGDRFPGWWDGFGGAVSAVCRPAQVTDPEDGQGAHLIGLNLYRAHVLDLLGAQYESVARAHLEAALPYVTGAGWAAEHWLASFAVLAVRR